MLLINLFYNFSDDEIGLWYTPAIMLHAAHSIQRREEINNNVTLRNLPFNWV